MRMCFLVSEVHTDAQMGVTKNPSKPETNTKKAQLIYYEKKKFALCDYFFHIPTKQVAHRLITRCSSSFGFACQEKIAKIKLNMIAT